MNLLQNIFQFNHISVFGVALWVGLQCTLLLFTNSTVCVHFPSILGLQYGAYNDQWSEVQDERLTLLHGSVTWGKLVYQHFSAWKTSAVHHYTKKDFSQNVCSCLSHLTSIFENGLTLKHETNFNVKVVGKCDKDWFKMF